jgi:hypothetical protein
MTTILDLILLAAFIYVAVDFVRRYHAATGTVWQRLLATSRQSATILWQRFTIALAAFADALIWFADLLNAPGVADAIRSVLQPQYVAVFVVVLAIVSELARRRTLPVADATKTQA